MSVTSLLAEFGLKKGPGAFSGVTRQAFTEGLRDRVALPDSVRQGGSSLCGPAALMRSLLLDNPELYVRYAISLFETGEAQLGKIHVAPSADCRACNPGKHISAVDWVTLASLRDSENDVFDYDDPSDQFAGITMPGELAGWFEKVGYVNVVNETDIYFSMSRREIDVAVHLRDAGQRVCLFVEASVIKKKSRGTSILSTPDHWVMLERSLGTLPHFGTSWDQNGSNWGVIGDRVNLEIWSWGDTFSFTQDDRNAFDSDDFSGRFYGYVAAEFRLKY